MNDLRDFWLHRANGDPIPDTPDLKSLVDLPPTEKLESERVHLYGELDSFYGEENVRRKKIRLPYLDRQLELARQRDALAEDRPDGCWCLGLGGRGQRTAYEDVMVWHETCEWCPEGKAAAEHRSQARQEALKRESQEWAESIWGNAQIPKRFQEFTLDSWPSGKQHPLIIKRLGGATGSWLLWGPFGTGKTGLVISMARERVWPSPEGTGNVLFASVPSLLSEIRATYNRNSDADAPTEIEVITRYAEAGLLILDDLGAEHITGSGWVEDRLYQIVGVRHDEERDTLFTSNLPLPALANRIGGRISWRIAEMVGEQIIELDTGNLRAPV